METTRRLTVLFLSMLVAPGLLAGCGSETTPDTEPEDVSCSSLACAAEHRECTEGIDGEAAQCDACLAGHFDAQGVCNAVSAECGDDQYEAAAPTAMSDRDCHDLTPECGSDQYEHEEPTPTSDRICCHYHQGNFVSENADDWLKFDESCLYIEGDLTLKGSVPQNTRLVHVGGSVMVVINNSIENFEGLENLEAIGGEFHVAAASSLVNFEGLEGLESIGGDFHLVFANALVNFEGLESLEFIGGQLDAQDNPMLCPSIVTAFAESLETPVQANNNNGADNPACDLPPN